MNKLLMVGLVVFIFLPCSIGNFCARANEIQKREFQLQ